MALTGAEEALVRELIAQNASLLSLADNEATITSKLGAAIAELSDLAPSASVAGGDLMLIRQGTTDKSVTPAVLMAPFFGDAGLAALTDLAPAADRVPYFTGTGTSALATLTGSGRSLISQGSYSAMRSLLGLDTMVVPQGGIIAWSGSVASIPTGWALCNGASGTPNLTDRFIIGAGGAYAVGASGGAVAHSHSITVNTATTGITISTTTATVNADGDPPNALTSATPNDPGHFHNASADNDLTLPPYYALAFIMRL